MKKIEDIPTKINVSKEVLEALPKNNAKNIEAYKKKLNELQLEFKGYEVELIDEMNKRVESFANVKPDPVLLDLKKKIESGERILYILNYIDTPFEKLNLGKAVQSLNYYYKTNFKQVNENILYCIKMFETIGIKLTPNDFCYNSYVKEYIVVLFSEIDVNGDVVSNKVKDKFEEIYWKCPEIITHIELNIRNIYLKNRRYIEKYFKERKNNITSVHTDKEVLSKYTELKKEMLERDLYDKTNLINGFMSGGYNPKDYTDNKIRADYLKFVEQAMIDNASKEEMQELNHTLDKLYNSLYEYKNYLKFEFIIDGIKKLYEEKTQNKNIYEKTKKEIEKKEKKQIALSKKNKVKNDELILEIKQLYKKLDTDKVSQAVSRNLKDDSTILEALYVASSFYTYSFKCIRANDEDKTDDETSEMVEELREFVRWPSMTIINNTALLDATKNLMLIIKDRYKLLNVEMAEEDLTEDNLDSLMKTIREIQIANSIKKNGFSIDEITNICEMKKILKSNT